ncbi:PRC-barrel domain protein [Stanieria cyanosphaera PCC 7437]|uniref:PRC-barrel domain protein n=1 Tax=Stanieria cyanosphaera (strain ATCC 29371 / PCC 7437) TaxID=111780 RepID=K9XP11_STAC7|nr:PRC-barrel domain-containing protein [Stanieria cyanosphaera]AFZ33781.1 PRC-barrel domain protein [Stanieria cyanosphaera PCC 7437]
MTTENIRLRSEFLNTQVIARNSGKRLGVVKEILVDIDRREIVALGLRDNFLSVSGIPKYMYLESIRQTGDVILVEDENVIEDIEIEAYTKLISCEVITEAGEPLGKVRDFQFNIEDGKIYSIIIASLGIPQIPEQIISTYELSIEEVVSSGPNRLIVFEGAEEKITQITVGLLERLGIGRPPWEREEESYYPPTVKAENQLPTGVPVGPPIATPIETRTPVMEETWDEDEWQEARVVPPVQKAQAVPYVEYEEDLEEDNWGGIEPEPERVYDTPVYEARTVEEYEYQEQPEDMWDDDENPKPYNPPPLNIPERQKEKAPEYEEEAG